jgi:diguanylate cyclase (GGDEF)-like protein
MISNCVENKILKVQYIYMAKLNIHEIIFNKSKIVNTFLGLFIIIILWFIDLFLDYRISFSIFYVLPVILVTWNSGYKAGLIFSFLCSCLWFIAAYISGSTHYPIPILIWNSIVRLSFFIIISYTINIFKEERKNARFDFLTKIPNRRYFSELFRAEIYRSVRYGHPLSIAYMDIDNFKTVNDKLGHQTGDNLLKIVSKTIKNNVRSTDIVARLGRDEFVILLIETTENPALELIQKVQNELLRVVKKKAYLVTFSFGLVTFMKFPKTAREMLKIADDCMYKAKKEGKNKIAIRVMAK